MLYKKKNPAWQVTAAGKVNLVGGCAVSIHHQTLFTSLTGSQEFLTYKARSVILLEVCDWQPDSAFFFRKKQGGGEMPQLIKCHKSLGTFPNAQHPFKELGIDSPHLYPALQGGRCFSRGRVVSEANWLDW